MSDPLILQAVRSADALEALRPAWRELHRRCPDATPFQSPEWLIPWWRSFGDGTLCTWTASSDGELVAVAPLYLWSSPERGRMLLLLGAGTSDYLDALCLPAHRARFATALLDVLRDERWDVCELAQLRKGSSLLHGALPTRLGESRTPDEACAVLRFAPGASLDTCIPKRVQQNLRYYRRRAERLGHVEAREVAPGDAEASFDRLVSLHGLRWSHRGAPGVLADDRVLAVHREAVPELARAGMLRLYELLIDGRVAASLYALADARPHGSVYYYVGGFDPAFGEASPGTLVIAHAIAQAHGSGAHAFDFLRGREPYKYLWGARGEITWHRTITRE